MAFDKLLDNEGLDEANSDFSTIKASLRDIWTGDTANGFDLSLDGIVSTIDKIYESINVFNTALVNLYRYKENKRQIAKLAKAIEQEMQNPSLRTTETYVENGVTKTSIKYVVDQELIDRLQAQINLLLKENEELRGNISKSCDTITSLNIKPKNNSDISHRGYRTGAVRDNSIEAFVTAGEKGFWGCETDVRFDSNGRLICSHNAPKNGENPPSFEEYLDICKEYGMTAIIDLKYAKGVGPADPYLSPAILKTIEEKGMMDSCVLQTNNPIDIPYIRQTAADARIWYLTDSTSEKNLNLMKENAVECVNMQSGDSNLYSIRVLSDNGIDTCVWNVQSESRKNQLLSGGAKYIMSDNVLGITPYQEGEEDFNNIGNKA